MFLQAPPAQHDEVLVEDALERTRTCANAGADGLFVPGLADEHLIGRVVEGSPLPVNVMVAAGTPPLAQLAEFGVARVSHGPGPYLLTTRALEDAARVALSAT